MEKLKVDSNRKKHAFCITLQEQALPPVLVQTAGISTLTPASSASNFPGELRHAALQGAFLSSLTHQEADPAHYYELI